MSEPLVLRETDQAIAILTLNHPARRNALSRAVLTSLQEQIGAIESDDAVRVVILRAAGTVFSSGHDLRELVGKSREEYESLFRLCTQVMEGLRQLGKPVIASVQGLATAAGCQLVASCDLVVASEAARFATPGVQIGLFCTTPAVPLVRTVLPRRALEMLLTGEPIDANEAWRIGLVNRVVPPDRLSEATKDLARRLLRFSPEVLALGKRAFYDHLGLSCADAYDAAEKVMVANALLDDAQEGIRAFLEKRSPVWSTESTGS